MALEKRRPIDLLTTSVEAQLVDDVIERMQLESDVRRGSRGWKYELRFQEPLDLDPRLDPPQ